MRELLKERVAVVFGAGWIGATVAKAFAEEGATVYVASLHGQSSDRVAAAIRERGGNARCAQVDAMDKESVERFIASVVNDSGRVDVSFNAVNVARGGDQGRKIVELDYESFALPIATYTKAQFVTAKAVAPQMIRQRSGVIMSITALPSRLPLAGTAGFGPAWAAIEALSRTLAVELGPFNIRTICLHSTGSPETSESIARTFVSEAAAAKSFMNEFRERAPHLRLIPGSASLENVGAMAAFMASDRASATTGTIANMTAGMTL